MISGHIAHGYKGELYIWVAETPEKRRENDQELAEENRRKRQRIEDRQTRARIPGTEENRILSELNANIEHHNQNRQPGEPPRMP